MNFELRTSNFLGVDVGGTTTRVGAVSSIGELLRSDRFDTPRSAAGLLDRIAGRIAALEATFEPAALVGVALPGPVDRARGVLVRSVNLPFLQDVPLEDEFAKRTSKKVVLMTDAEAATWGEYAACEPRPTRFVHLRFGTGIACGTVLDGVLTPTDPERRTHLPALVVDERPAAAACACGLRGCLELFASGPVISRLARKMGLRRELASLQSDAKRGRHEAQQLVSGVGGWIVRGIRRILDPLPDGRGSEGTLESSVVCLGGGVLAAVPALFEEVRTRWNAQGEAQRCGVEIRPARSGDDAGVIGAAMLASSW